jgi:hypothetical protein
MTCRQQLELRPLIITKTIRYASKQIFDQGMSTMYTEEALMANLGQLSSQSLVFLLHCKVILAHVREALEKRLHRRYRKCSAREFLSRGQAQV